MAVRSLAMDSTHCLFTRCFTTVGVPDRNLRELRQYTRASADATWSAVWAVLINRSTTQTKHIEKQGCDQVLYTHQTSLKSRAFELNSMHSTIVLSLYCELCFVLTVRVEVNRQTSKRSSVGMGKDVYRSLKIKHRFSKLSRAIQQEHSFVKDLSYI